MPQRKEKKKKMGIIGSIRKHAWVAVLLVALAIVAFIIGDDSVRSLFSQANYFAKVNGEEISYQAFDDQIKQREEALKAQYGIEQFTNEQEQSIRSEVWEKMIMDKLTMAEVEKLGLNVSNAELSAMFAGKVKDPFVMQYLADPATGMVNLEVVKYYSEHFNELDEAQQAQWLELQNTAMDNRMYTKYSSLISKGFYTPKALAQKVSDLSKNVADACLIRLPLESVSDDEAAISEDDYKKYYDQHKEEFRQSEELREIHYVVFNVAPTQADLDEIQNDVMKEWDEFKTTPDENIPFFVNSTQNHYDSTYVKASQMPAPFDTIIPRIGAGNYIEPMQFNNNWFMGKVLASQARPDSMRATVIYVLNDKAGQNTVTRNDEAAKLRADSVAAMLKSNKISLEDAMAQYSDVPQNGADTTWMIDGAFGMLNEDIIKTQVGGVFTYADPRNIGYYVVKVTGKTAATTKYRVALIAHEIAPSASTSRNIYNEATKFMGQNHTYQEMLAAAQQQNLAIRNSYSRIMDYNVANLKNVREMVRWAFNKDTKAGDVAQQVFESEDMYIVAAVKEVFKKGVPELAQIHDMIEANVRLEKKKEILMAKAEAAAKESKDLNAMAVKLGATIDTVSGISYNSYYLGAFGMEPKVIGAISAAKGDKVLGPIKGSAGVYMVQPFNIQAQPALDPEAIRANMAQSAQQKAYLQKLVQILKEYATIKDQRSLFF